MPSATLADLPLAPPFAAADHVNDKLHHILLAATGSVATIKIPNIASALSKHPNVSIRIILTPSAAKFLQGQSAEQPTLADIRRIPHVEGVYTDPDEWTPTWVRGNKILHIELRKWAQVMLVAPLSANSMAEFTMGLAGGLVSSVFRAWDTTGLVDGKQNRPMILVAPAMNTAMWRHPVTGKQVRVLKEWEEEGWVRVLRPMEKELACGDVGDGAMMDWRDIVDYVEGCFGLSKN